MNRPTIILAEDHADVADQLRQLLSEPFDVIAVVSHGEALLKAAARLKPDIVVLDISMPGMDGLSAAQELRNSQPSIGLVFVTVHDDRALARKALGVGLGYVLKASAGEELVDAVNAALTARAFASAALGPLHTLMSD